MGTSAIGVNRRSAKSTTLKTALGLVKPTSGTAIFMVEQNADMVLPLPAAATSCRPGASCWPTVQPTCGRTSSCAWRIWGDNAARLSVRQSLIWGSGEIAKILRETQPDFTWIPIGAFDKFAIRLQTITIRKTNATVPRQSKRTGISRQSGLDQHRWAPHDGTTAWQDCASRILDLLLN